LIPQEIRTPDSLVNNPRTSGIIFAQFIVVWDIASKNRRFAAGSILWRFWHCELVGLLLSGHSE